MSKEQRDAYMSLNSALVRCLGVLLLTTPDLRFGFHTEDENAEEEAARYKVQDAVQLQLRERFLSRVGVFPTHHEQWILSLEPATRAGAGVPGSRAAQLGLDAASNV